VLFISKGWGSDLNDHNISICKKLALPCRLCNWSRVTGGAIHWWIELERDQLESHVGRLGILEYVQLWYKRHTLAGLSECCTDGIAQTLCTSLLNDWIAPWGHRGKPIWYGIDHEKCRTWHAGKWHQHSLTQRAWCSSFKSPRGWWRWFCIDPNYGSESGYKLKIHPWGRGLCGHHTHQSHGRWKVWESCLWDMPDSNPDNWYILLWCPAFYSQG